MNSSRTGSALSSESIPVAWLGRTSTEDSQDPTLSLPRQLRRSIASMPANWVVVAHYYDIESGRKDLEARGRGSEHENFDIPIPRDGGIRDLLEAAARPDRPFAAVICESIERVARRTYFGTMIEYELERCGVVLCAADEPMNPASRHRRSTSTLTRRVKQAVAEWYVLQLLELSWDGTVEHTHQGWNIGKPPYGYIAEPVPHPVPARRVEGRTKHRLAPHPVQGPVVTRIFEMRIEHRAGYDAIADELNRDLTLNPPPEPTREWKRVGRWTGSSVREILINPKYTGFMVYNRRATKQRGGRSNPPEEWIWSPQPVHPALVTLEQFDEVGLIARAKNRRLGRRIEESSETVRYLLRSYLWCELCGRRIWGKTHSGGRVYYMCVKDRRQHADQPWFNLHPPAVRVRSIEIEKEVCDFLATHLAAPGQHEFERATDNTSASSGSADEQIAGLRSRQARLIEELEGLDEHGLDGHSMAMLRTDILQRYALLGRLIAAQSSTEDIVFDGTHRILREALTSLPMTPEAQRAAFDACSLRVSYLHPTRRMTITATTWAGEVVGERRINSSG
jgi:hypothetical protein